MDRLSSRKLLMKLSQSQRWLMSDDVLNSTHATPLLLKSIQAQWLLFRSSLGWSTC